MHRHQIVRLGIVVLLGVISHRSTFGKLLVWDLGGVLFAPNKMKIAQKVGLWNCLGCLGGQARSIWSDVQNTARPYRIANRMIVPDDQGSPLSSIYCEYMAGLCSSKQAQIDLENGIKLLDSFGYFKNKRQYNFACNLVHVIFDPYTFAHTMKPIAKGVKLLKKCAQAVDQCTNEPHTLMILSNWDRESFSILLAMPQHQEIFSHFHPNNIIISGMFGSLSGLKPHPAIFDFIIRYSNVDPSEIVFIDDQAINIEAAKHFGIAGIILENGNYEKLEQDLRIHGILND